MKFFLFILFCLGLKSVWCREHDAVQFNHNEQIDSNLFTFLATVFQDISCSFVLTSSSRTDDMKKIFEKQFVFYNIVNRSNKYEHISRITKRFKQNTCVLFLYDDYNVKEIEEWWKHLENIWIIMILNKSDNKPKKFSNKMFNAFNIFVAQPISNNKWTYVVYSSNYKKTYKFWKLGDSKIQLPARSVNPKFNTKKIGIVDFPPTIQLESGINNTIKVLGYIDEVMNSLSILLKMDFEYVIAEDNQFGAFVNGSWTGMMGLLVNKKVDIAAGLTPTNIRLQYVDFTLPIYVIPWKILYRVSDREEWDLTFFLKPFQKTLWIAVFVINLIVISIIIFYKSPTNSNDKINKKWKRKLTKQRLIVDVTDDFSLCWPFITMGGGLSIFSVVSLRSVLLSYSIFANIIIQSYNSHLTAIFSVVKLSIPFKSFKEMVEETNYFPVIVAGVNLQDDFSTRKTEPWISGWKRIQKNKAHSLVKSTQEGINTAYNYKAGFITTNRDIAEILKNNCQFEFSVKDIISSSDTFSFAFLPDALLKKLFNKRLIQLKQSGILKVIRERYFVNWKSCSNEHSVKNPVSLGQIIGPIVILLSGILLSIFISLLELFVDRFIY